MTLPHAIDVTNLNKWFGQHHAVRDLSLQVRAGEIFGFLGPNGSGKTTSIRMICGLLQPDSGTGTCMGLDVLRESDAIKRQVGYMTQRFSLWEDLSIAENLDFMARMFGCDRRRERVDRVLSDLGLQARRRQLAGTLSGGWKQRLALAACLLHEPRLLLLDEPTAGVDPKARRDFWEQIHRLAESGITVLVSTHYMDEALRCHRLAYIADGRLLTQGTADDVVRQQGLHTWVITGPVIEGWTDRLRHLPGVELVANFGNSLHVSGQDQALLEQSLRSTLADTGLRMAAAEPTLEDVFIHLMREGAQP